MSKVASRTESLLLSVANSQETRVVLIALTAAGPVLGVILWLYALPVALLLFLISGSALSVLILAHKARKRQAVSRLGKSIREHLKRTGLRSFVIDDVQDITEAPPSLQRQALMEVYAVYCASAVKDGQITSRERGILDALADALRLSAEEKQRVEQSQAKEAYRNMVSAALGDSVITPEEAQFLQRARQHLEVSDAEATELNRNELIDVYRTMFRRFAEDGILTDDEIKQLDDFRQAVGLSAQQAAKISHSDALKLFNRTVAITCQQDQIRQSDHQKLTQLGDVLGLSSRDTMTGLARFEQAFRVGEIRRGRLPTIETRILLKSTEVAHYEAACAHAYRTRTREIRLTGTLTITNKRIILTGERSFELNLKRVLDIQEYSDGVMIRASGRGQGVYFVEDPDMMAAILSALVRSYNREAFDQLDSTRTRHIPDHVKVEAWRRDGGVCVKCGASDYLEFDHIIPFSKGGANTVNNVQLLCRRCNLAKGAELG